MVEPLIHTKAEGGSTEFLTAQKGAQRNTHQVGERHTGTHHRHRLGSLALLCHLHCHDGTRAEVGTMRKDKVIAVYDEYMKSNWQDEV